MRPERKKAMVILIADDDLDDQLLAKEALTESKVFNPVFCVNDGEELLDYLNNRGVYKDKKQYTTPGIILLDLNMPRMDGREALQHIKSNPKLKSIPIVVLTTSKAEEDILRSYNLGVNSFVIKPVTFQSMVEVMKAIANYWLEIVELPIANYGG